MDGEYRVFEKNVADLRDCLQDVINDAANRGRGNTLEAMSALSTVLIKMSVNAGIDVDDFIGGLQMLFVMETAWKNLEPEVYH
jgi:hypothetical protein